MLNVSSGGHSVVINAPWSPSWPQACPGKRRVTAWVTERARTQTSPVRNAELFLGTPKPQEAQATGGTTSIPCCSLHSVLCNEAIRLLQPPTTQTPSHSHHSSRTPRALCRQHNFSFQRSEAMTPQTFQNTPLISVFVV